MKIRNSRAFGGFTNKIKNAPTTSPITEPTMGTRDVTPTTTAITSG